MAFQLSPGVEVNEIDLTTIIPAVSTTRAGFAGFFNWGPIGTRVQVTSINDLVRVFGLPDNVNYTYWFTAANYLGYSNNLQIVRVVSEDSRNASVSVTGAAGSDQELIENEEDFAASSLTDAFYAKYPGVLGNSISISVSDRTHLRLDPIFATSSTSGFADAPTSTSSTVFYHMATETGVIGSDLLQFKRGTPQTITGYTASFVLVDSVGANLTVPANTQIGSTASALAFNAGKTGVDGLISVGDYISIEQGGVKGYAYVTGITHGTVSGTTIGIGSSGFGFAAGTTSTAALNITVLGKITTGNTFVNADGITNARLLWKYYNEFETELPSTSAFVENHGNSFDLVHTIVVDEDGAWTGTKGTVLERFGSLSKAPNAKALDGASIYYKDRINSNSNYIWSATKPSIITAGQAWETDSSSDGGSTYAALTRNFYGSLTGGSAGIPTGNDFYTNGYELFADSETVDISLILGGPAEGIQAKQLVDLVGSRKDAVVFLSPPKNSVINTGETSKSAGVATANVVAYRDGTNGADAGGDQNYENDNLNVSSSYAVLDSGWKYMYDRFNDVFRFVPMNGDIAGIAVRSDNETETWFSPAGFNRGQLRGVVKLAYNPLKAQRDDLYQAGINPVVSFPGEGTILFGDKTLQSKPSAFDRINVRRLFIVLEKAIATAAKFSLFEQNDAFTRSQFRQLIEPFLRDVQSRRGIIDFKVVCDETNNTGEVIDRNEFVADIFIKPTRSINFITLNFIATRTGVSFDEIGGAS